MRLKPQAAWLAALVIVCMAAVAWAAEAPRIAPVPQSTPSAHAQASSQARPDAPPMDREMADADDPDMGALGIEDGPDGAGPADGSRRVIVRRFMRDGAGGGMGPGRGGFGRMLQALDLTDEQREKLADLRDRRMRREIQARADLQIARLDLRRAITAERPETGTIDSQIDHVARLRAEMAKARVAGMLEARDVLTPEQQRKMRDLRGAGPGAGMERGMGMGPGGPGMDRGGRPMRVQIRRGAPMSQ